MTKVSWIHNVLANVCIFIGLLAIAVGVGVIIAKNVWRHPEPAATTDDAFLAYLGEETLAAQKRFHAAETAYAEARVLGAQVPPELTHAWQVNELLPAHERYRVAETEYGLLVAVRLAYDRRLKGGDDAVLPAK